jgi:curved DNA-binding protein CbpA
MTDSSRQPKADYYHLLQLTPAATQDDVKKAFRQLALQFHPDRNSTESAALFFAQVKEAYECLSDNESRARYDRERQLNPRYKAFVSMTPEAILFRFRELEKKISGIHPDRIDRDALFAEIEILYSSFHLNLLREKADINIKTAIVSITLQLATPLSGRQFYSIMQITKLLAGDHPQLQKEISQFMREQQLYHVWSRYKILLAMLIAILLCLGIYAISR